jgi:hypothetical protein
MMRQKINNGKQSTSYAGHLHSHGGAPVQCKAHRPMQHVQQGYTGSHWTPPLPLGDYSLRITPAATRATANKTTMTNVPTLRAVLMVAVVQRDYTVCITRWRRFMAFLKETKHRHWTSTHSDSINRTCQRRLFLIFHCEKGHRVQGLPQITIRV